MKIKSMPLIFFISIIILTGCSPFLTVSRSQSDGKIPLPVDSSVFIGKLANGLTYYIRVNREPENRAELRLAVNAGSVLETEQQQGLAHFAEHMAFNGSEHFKKNELIDYLESIGMRFGPDLNAYTGFDETAYMLQIPTDSLPVLRKGFTILSDWAQKVSYEDTEIDKERGVIKEEWRLGRGAAARIRDKQLPVIFHDSRYAERLPIGKIEVIDTFKYDTLRRFYHDWYRPELMAVVAVGDFDPEQVKKWIEEEFSSLSNPADAPARKSFTVPEHHQTLYAVASDSEAVMSSVQIYFKRNARSQLYEKDYRESLIEGLVNRMLNQRFLEISRQPDAPFLNAFSGSGNLCRTKETYILGAQAREGEIVSAFEALLTEALRAKKFGFTQGELERQKTKMLTYMERSFKEKDKIKSSSFAGKYVRNFLRQEPIPGIAYEYLLYQKFLPEITLAEVNDRIKSLISDKNRVITVSAPQKKGIAIPDSATLDSVIHVVKKKKTTPYHYTTVTTPLLEQIPSGGEIAEEKYLPEIDVYELTLSNGVKIVVKPTDFKNDEILFTAFSPGGSSLVADSNYIAAVTAASVITESGLGQFNRTDLQKILNDKIAMVRPWIDETEEGLSGRSSVKDLETMMQLIYLYFTSPRIDTSAFKAYQNKLRGYLANRSASPEAAFSDTVQVTVSGHHFRYRPWSTALLEEMNPDRSLEIYRQRFSNGDDFTFIFVGKIDIEKFKKAAARYLGALPAYNHPEKARDTGVRFPEGITRKTVFKGREPKSKVHWEFSGDFTWNAENRFLLRALARILAIRLRESLREDQGGTYGVRVWANPSHRPVDKYNLVISFGCAPDRTEELIVLTRKIIDSLKTTPIKPLYLNKTKEMLHKKHETDLKENGYWLKILNFYYDYAESPLQVNEFTKMADNITAEKIKEAARQYLNENKNALFILKPQK